MHWRLSTRLGPQQGIIISRFVLKGWDGLGGQKASFYLFSVAPCDTIVVLAGWAPPADLALAGDEKSLQTLKEPLLLAVVFEEMYSWANILQPVGIFKEEAAPLEAFAIRKAELLQILVSGKEDGLDLRDLITATRRRADPPTTSWARPPYCLNHSLSDCLIINLASQKHGVSPSGHLRVPNSTTWRYLLRGFIPTRSE